MIADRVQERRKAMKIYVYDFTAEGMEVSDSQGNRIGLCCYDEDESAGTTRGQERFDHADLSLFGREINERGGPSPVPFFAAASDANATQSIGFGDLLISEDYLLDLFEDMDEV